MKQKVFIQTNNKQRLGALLSKYSIEKHLSDKTIGVEIMNVDNHPAFKNFIGKTYLRKGKKTVYDPNDLQSFTLSRFAPPELMNFEGRALVVDPDVFALQDIDSLLNMNMAEQAVACCEKSVGFDTSVMLLDCVRLPLWSMTQLLDRLAKQEIDYDDLMSLRTEERIKVIPRIWNNLDRLTPETKMIHMTNRLTQPWKTGLAIDFTRARMPKLFNLIPREPIYTLLGKYPTSYQPHPDKQIEHLFLSLTKEALKDGAITTEQIQKELADKHIRADIFRKLEMV